jgi:adenosylmethionine-8-amino-7-oxononanoate aminotransferase
MKTLGTRDKASIWHPFTQVATAPEPIGIVKAEGVWLYAEDGTRYLDGTASWWVNAHGHSHPHIAQRIANQAHQLEHIIFAGFTHEPAVLLAEHLLMRAGSPFGKVFYSDNGSTSVEVALKIALQYFHNQNIPRTRIIAFENGYHGDTFGAMAVGHRNAFSAAFGSLLFDVSFLPAPDQHAPEVVCAALDTLLQEGDVAAFIFEPLVQGANGMRMYPAELLNRLISQCRNAGALSIADEVFTGFWRTGTCFAWQQLNIVPDIFCLSKTLTGGFLPLGATLVPEFIFDAFRSQEMAKTFFHGHSYTANPLSCTAALASLELFDADCISRIGSISEQHRNFCKQIEGHPALLEARCLGTILALELKTDAERGYLNPVASEITSYFLKQGIYLRPLGNVIYCTPPYVMEAEALEWIYQHISAYLDQRSNTSVAPNP